ncbi:MAG: hypothetical protein D6824_09555 [Planctomycetota bacterium]|nr:MAG: hypothetical protein D6824_09555 [Planctomycetota bacterium]
MGAAADSDAASTISPADAATGGTPASAQAATLTHRAENARMVNSFRHRPGGSSPAAGPTLRIAPQRAPLQRKTALRPRRCASRSFGKPVKLPQAP